MNRKEAERRTRQSDTLHSLGFTRDEADTLRRISNTLQRWFEHECNGVIQRDEDTDKPYWYNMHTGKRMYAAPDRETGAMKRLTNIMANHAPLNYYIQDDCRGASLYIIRPGDVPKGADFDAYYSRGICVY